MAAFHRNYSIAAKVRIVMASVVVGAVAFGIGALWQVYQVNANAAAIRDTWLPGTRALGDFRYYMTRFRSAEGSYTLSTPGEVKDKQLARLGPIADNADKAFDEYKKLVSSGPARDQTKRIAAAWAEYKPMLEKLIELNKNQDRDAAGRYFMGPMRTAFDKLNTAVDAGITFNNENGVAAGNASEAIFHSSRLETGVAIALAVALALFAAWVLVSSVCRPVVRITGAMSQLAAGDLTVDVPHSDQRDEIGQLAEAMSSFKNQLAAAERAKAEQTKVIVSSIGTGLDHLAKGDLTHRVTADLTGDFAKLKRDFNEAMNKLQETMKDVLSTTTGIATGANEVSQAADDLSRRTEQQAASLEETAAALDEITATVKKTAANSKQVSLDVANAKSVAEDGGQVVDTAIQAMDAIAQSSKQITDIIGVIDEIAFQTNLLALNAGVEAARAGDAGKGFAVVASEVRGLAQRSGEAAKQIKALIGASGEHVEVGVKYVGESGAALKRIVDQVAQINALIGEMALATEQQSTGIEQVNAAIGQMDQITQQNAAMVEQSTAASRNLAGETKKLTEFVGFFSVDNPVLSTSPKTPAGFTPIAAGPTTMPRARSFPKSGSVVPLRNRAATAQADGRVAEAGDDWIEF